MVKSKAPKIFKIVKKVIDEKENLCIRFKNLDKKQIKELKSDLDRYCKAYFVPEE